MIERERLAGRWIHSHEEDTDAEMVFREAGSGYALPPARGRDSFELRSDGFYVETVPGPSDRPENRPGNWSLEDGDRLVLVTEGRGSERVLHITSAADEVLRVRK